MKKIKMTTRKKDILNRLCKEQDYITIGIIAQEIGVSTRTILRELEELEGWLGEKELNLDKKTGVGIRLDCSINQRQGLLAEIEKENTIKTFTPEERQTIIASELLQKNEPIKLYYLTKILNVSEGTISNDLDKLEEWLAGYQLNLIRKPGLGVYVEGKEKHKRRAIVNLIYENVEEKQLLNFVKENIANAPSNLGSIEIKTRNRLLNLIDKETIGKLEELIYQAEDEMGYKLADSAYVGLIVHLALAIKRIKNNEKITMDQDFLKELKKNSEFLIAKALADNISNLFNIEIHEDEVGYITMHLMGSKNRGNVSKGSGTTISNFELVKLAREIIKTAEAETGQFLGNNEKLLEGLVNHLEPALKRLKLKMDIRNPLLEEIKSLYPQLIKISEKCAGVIEEYLGEKLPESEIAYIAMHLGAVIEKREILPKTIYRVAVACPSGIGTSRLLAAKIEREYDIIQVVDIISTLHVEENWLKQEEIDFIISTMSIENTSIPVVIVNPLLLEADKNKIDRLISQIKGVVKPGREKRIPSLSLKDKLIQLHYYSEGIIQILDHFFLQSFSVKEIEELISLISEAIVDDKDRQNQLKQDLLLREQKGGTLITGKGISLLHCRSTSVKALYFGAVRLINKLSYPNGRGKKEEIDLVIVMLAPENSNQAQLEVISEVSKLIIDRPQFLNLLREGLRDEAYLEISSRLNEFYQFKSNQ